MQVQGHLSSKGEEFGVDLSYIVSCSIAAAHRPPSMNRTLLSRMVVCETILFCMDVASINKSGTCLLGFEGYIILIVGVARNVFAQGELFALILCLP